MNIELDGKQVIVPKFKLFKDKDKQTFVFVINNLSNFEIEDLNNKILKNSKTIIEKNGFYIDLKSIYYYFNFDFKKYNLLIGEFGIVIAFSDENENIIEKKYKEFKVVLS